MYNEQYKTPEEMGLQTVLASLLDHVYDKLGEQGMHRNDIIDLSTRIAEVRNRAEAGQEISKKELDDLHAVVYAKIQEIENSQLK